MQRAEIRQGLFHRIRVREMRQPSAPRSEPVNPLFDKRSKFFRLQLFVTLLCGPDGLQWRQVKWPHYL